MDRALRYGLEPQEGLEESLEQVRSVVELESEYLSDNFMELFAENATVAIITRSMYEPDNPLSEEDLKYYLDQAVAFFNCLGHRHGGRRR